jgi:hypothetical protein
MKPGPIQISHCFIICFAYFTTGILSRAQSQTAYEWYKNQLNKKQANEYWANAIVDTVIKLEVFSENKIVPPQVRYGQAVNLASFLRNPAVILPAKKTIIAGNVYFTGKGFPVPKSVDMAGPYIMPGIQLLENCETGTTLTFDVYLSPDSSKERLMIAGNFILTNFQKKDLPTNLPVDTSIIEAMETLKRRFTSGTIYFTGAGFRAAESIPASESNFSSRSAMIARMQPGTILVFDNCIYIDPNTKTAVNVNKTIKLLKLSK